MIEQQLALQTECGSIALPAAVSCPGCGCWDYTDFFEARDLPVHVGNFYDTAQEAIATPTGDVTLSFCHGCGLVFNRRFDGNKISYEPGYEVALHHSETFRKFMDGVATRLIERFNIRNKNVLEIGCGCGYFLRMLCERGDNHAVGIDPTIAREGVERVGGGSVRFIRDFFSDRYADIPADFICCLSVFEHIPDPLHFLTMLRRMIGDRRPGIYFEIFNAFDAFRREETWSIHYEQSNYFSKESLAGVFQRSEFEVIEAATCYEGDQYLFVDSVPANLDGDKLAAKESGRLDLPEAISNFAERHEEKLNTWKDHVARWKSRGERVVLWGTGGKGITFVNSLDTAEAIPFVVEINPDKQGKYVPGTGQRIVPPEFMADYRPDKVIITNALYEKEMKQQAQDLGVTCEFLVA